MSYLMISKFDLQFTDQVTKSQIKSDDRKVRCGVSGCLTGCQSTSCPSFFFHSVHSGYHTWHRYRYLLIYRHCSICLRLFSDCSPASWSTVVISNENFFENPFVNRRNLFSHFDWCSGESSWQKEANWGGSETKSDHFEYRWSAHHNGDSAGVADVELFAQFCSVSYPHEDLVA